MLIDSTLVLSNKQAVTASAASEHIIDQTAAGEARHATVVALADEDFAGLSGLKISLQTAADSSFSSPKELAAASFVSADLKAGKALFKIPFPAGALRYIRGYYTVTGTGTAGKLSLFVTDEAGQ